MDYRDETHGPGRPVCHLPKNECQGAIFGQETHGPAGPMGHFPVIHGDFYAFWPIDNKGYGTRPARYILTLEIVTLEAKLQMTQLYMRNLELSVLCNCLDRYSETGYQRQN